MEAAFFFRIRYTPIHIGSPDAYCSSVAWFLQVLPRSASSASMIRFHLRPTRSSDSSSRSTSPKRLVSSQYSYPFRYLENVLYRLPGLPRDQLSELLPDRWQSPMLAVK